MSCGSRPKVFQIRGGEEAPPHSIAQHSITSPSGMGTNIGGSSLVQKKGQGEVHRQATFLAILILLNRKWQTTPACT